MSGILGISSSKSKIIGRPRDTAKVWVRFSVTTLNDSFNVSSITDLSGAGAYQVNFLTNLPNAVYAVVSGDYYWGIGLENNFAVSSVRTTRRTNGSGGAGQVTDHVSLIIFGS